MSPKWVFRIAFLLTLTCGLIAYLQGWLHPAPQR